MRGSFITFEGIDGCGKSTQVRRLATWIHQQVGREPLLVREPGGTRLGERIRDLLLDPATGDISSEAEALLYASSRAELVSEVIEPARAAGTAVIADRFLGSSLVYQGVARGLGIERVRAANDLAIGTCTPDVTILLDIPVDVAASRRAATGEAPDRIELAGTSFMEQVADAYRAIAASSPGWIVVAADADEDVVYARMLEQLDAAGFTLTAPAEDVMR